MRAHLKTLLISGAGMLSWLLTLLILGGMAVGFLHLFRLLGRIG